MFFIICLYMFTETIESTETLEQSAKSSETLPEHLPRDPSDAALLKALRRSVPLRSACMFR